MASFLDEGNRNNEKWYDLCFNKVIYNFLYVKKKNT